MTPLASLTLYENGKPLNTDQVRVPQLTKHTCPIQPIRVDSSRYLTIRRESSPTKSNRLNGSLLAVVNYRGGK